MLAADERFDVKANDPVCTKRDCKGNRGNLDGRDFRQKGRIDNEVFEMAMITGVEKLRLGTAGDAGILVMRYQVMPYFFWRNAKRKQQDQKSGTQLFYDGIASQ